MICQVLIFAIPEAVNNGVEGNGINVYSKTKS